MAQERVTITNSHTITLFSCSYLNVSAECNNMALSFNDKFLVNLGRLTLLVQAQDNKAVPLYG